MGMADKVWDTLTQVIKMNDRVISLSAQVSALATEMREMDRRLVRLETMLELALRGRTLPPPASSDEAQPGAR